MFKFFDLHFGDVLRLTSLNNQFVPGKKEGLVSVSYKAPKGRVFVAVLLGEEAKDGSAPLDLDAAMERLGWYRKNDKKD